MDGFGRIENDCISKPKFREKRKSIWTLLVSKGKYLGSRKDKRYQTSNRKKEEG